MSVTRKLPNSCYLKCAVASPRRRLFLCGFFHALKDFLQVGLREILPIQNDGGDFLRVADVLERIAVEKYQIREFSFFDGAQLPLHLKKAGGVQRSGLQSFQRCETGGNKAL